MWAGRTADFSLDGIRRALQSFMTETEASTGRVPVVPGSDERVSAVMGLLAEGSRGAEILLTRRSHSLTNHRGEISFPGGRVDEGESIVDAARRETWEEVGISVHPANVHAELSPMSTFVSRSFIVPVIASLDSRIDPRPNDGEVDRAFWVPLADLVREDTFVWEWWTFDRSASSGERPMYFFYLDDETVWGATARMLHELLCLVHGVRG